MTHGTHLNESIQTLAYDGGTDQWRYRTFPYNVGTHLSFLTEVQCFAYDVRTDLSFSTEVQMFRLRWRYISFVSDGGTDAATADVMLFTTAIQYNKSIKTLQSL